jgi:anaerobic ribonucleoside-triphosphate reductase
MDIRTEERYDDDFNQCNLFIMKRSGERVPFNESKIVRAIEKANAEVTIPLEKMSTEKIAEIAAQIRRDAENAGRDLSVEEIQDKVEDSLMIAGYCTLARLYITYRYKHNLDRKKSTLDKKIESLINVKVNKDGSVSGGNEEVNQENSNKDTKVLSVQRDYMAGEWSREYTNRNLLPEDVVNAHRSGLIHVHDTDYMAQPEHNCFSSKTEFVTRNGVVSFADCKDGQVVEVLDKDGVWREATVKCYGKQKLQNVVLKKDDEEKVVSCTANHRWILSDETVTTALKEGDVLYGHLWKVDSITTCDGALEDVWCVEEPVTHSFTLAGGIVTGNCCLINLEDMLQNETCISGTKIERPKSFMTASTVASQIIAQVASSQYGGQTISLAHLAPFVDISRQKILKRLSKEMSDIGIEVTEEKLKELAEKEVRKEVENGCQTLQYQLITLQTTNGQAPFVTVFMYLNEAKNEREKEDLALLIEVMFKQRMLGVKDSSGYYITPAFPKLIYCLQEDNIREDGKYWYLTELAAKCTAKRMVPDYISEKKMLELKGDVYPSMGCRSFLTPDRCSEKVGNIAHALNYEEGKPKYYGRFNQGVVTINLVDVACSSEGDEDKFWEILEERLNLCHKALRAKHERLLGTPSDVAPIQWQYGALARLKPGEVIDPLLFNGYSTISLGYAGLAECVYFMKHESHTSENGKEFGLKVMQALNDACGKWKAEENIDYSVYGTPLESTTYKFAKCLQKRFGKIPGVTDKNYITNSYHIRVTENINAFDKLTKEAEFQKLSPGGAISYVEVPNMQGNIPAVLAIIKHIYNTILYAELNTKSDQCEACGYNGEIQIVNKDSKLIWRCPQCGCTDQNKMHVARRTCGYIGTQYWNQGRTQEIAERVLHVSVDEDETEKNQ